MRFQIVMTSLVLAAVVSAQSSFSGPIPITGPSLSPPPSTGIETGTRSIETQSPRPAATTTRSSGSAAPTETFPSISEGPTGSSSSVPSATSTSRSATSPPPSATSALGSSTSRSATAVSSGAASPTNSPNAGVAVQVGVAGWSVVAVVAGVVAGAVLV